MSSAPKIVLIGEQHGDEEGLRLVKDILRRRSEPFTFCVELSEYLQRGVDVFRAMGDTAVFDDEFFTWQPTKDTAAFRDLLRSIEAENHVLCVAPNEVPEENPQQFLANHVANRINAVEGNVLALLGSVHASKAQLSVAGKDIKPAGYILREGARNVNVSTIPVPGYDSAPRIETDTS